MKALVILFPRLTIFFYLVTASCTSSVPTPLQTSTPSPLPDGQNKSEPIPTMQVNEPTLSAQPSKPPMYENRPMMLPAQEDLVDLAIADLSERLNIPKAEIMVLQTFIEDLPPDNSGCIQKPGALSAPDRPAFVPMTVILLQGGGDIHRYHARGRILVYCSPK